MSSRRSRHPAVVQGHHAGQAEHGGGEVDGRQPACEQRSVPVLVRPLGELQREDSPPRARFRWRAGARPRCWSRPGRRRFNTGRNAAITQQAGHVDLRDAQLAGSLGRIADAFAHRQDATCPDVYNKGFVLGRPRGERHIDEEYVGRDLKRLIPVAAYVLTFAPFHFIR